MDEELPVGTDNDCEISLSLRPVKKSTTYRKVPDRPGSTGATSGSTTSNRSRRSGRALRRGPAQEELFPDELVRMLGQIRSVGPQIPPDGQVVGQAPGDDRRGETLEGDRAGVVDRLERAEEGREVQMSRTQVAAVVLADVDITQPVADGEYRTDEIIFLDVHVVGVEVDAMAVGEHRFSFPEVAHMIMLKVGTGVGSGLIASGRVHRGADGAAGDIGHIRLALPEGWDEEPLCRCGNYGCVEAYAGGWAMARDLRSAGKDVQNVNDVLHCLRSGDTTAQQLLRRSGRILGLAVADAVSLFNPSVVAVCGQLADTDELLLAGIREIVYQRSLPLATRNLQIVRSQLDPRAGLLGLSLLLSAEIFSIQRIGALTGP